MLVYFVDVDGEEFSIPYRYVKGVNLIEELKESGLDGKLEISLPISKIMFFISLGPIFLKNLSSDELEKYIQNLDFLGVRNYSRVVDNHIVSETISETMYKKQVPVEILSRDPFELQGVLLEAVKAKDVDLLDKDNIFVNEFRVLLQKNPYMFANSDDYWIYERYVESSVRAEVPDFSKISLPMDINLATEIVFDESSDKYHDMFELSQSGATKLFLDLWERNKTSATEYGIEYADLFIEGDDIETLKKMIDLGLNINEQNKFGETALIRIAKNELQDFHGQRIVELLKLGADPAVIDRQDHSFMFYYISNIPIGEEDVHPLTDYFTVLEPYKSQILPLLRRPEIAHAILSHKQNSSLIEQAITHFQNTKP